LLSRDRAETAASETFPCPSRNRQGFSVYVTVPHPTSTPKQNPGFLGSADSARNDGSDLHIPPTLEPAVPTARRVRRRCRRSSSTPQRARFPRNPSRPAGASRERCPRCEDNHSPT